jgi:hypothetical protein
MAARFALLVGLAFISSMAVGSAADWTTTDGTTYRNVKVVSFNDGYVTILDNLGGARVLLRLLNPKLQKQFHYDAARAAVCEAATNAQDKAGQQTDSPQLRRSRQQPRANRRPSGSRTASRPSARLRLTGPSPRCCRRPRPIVTIHWPD